MNLKLILSTSAAALLAATAAHAQTAQGDLSVQGAGALDAPSEQMDSATAMPPMDSPAAAEMDAGVALETGDMSTQAGMGATAQQDQMDAEARSAGAAGEMASSTTGTQVTANEPIPDTAENRERFGGPESRTGQMSTPSGN